MINQWRPLYHLFTSFVCKTCDVMAGHKYDHRVKNKKDTTPLPYSWDVGGSRKTSWDGQAIELLHGQPNNKKMRRHVLKTERGALRSRISAHIIFKMFFSSDCSGFRSEAPVWHRPLRTREALKVPKSSPVPFSTKVFIYITIQNI